MRIDRVAALLVAAAVAAVDRKIRRGAENVAQDAVQSAANAKETADEALELAKAASSTATPPSAPKARTLLLAILFAGVPPLLVMLLLALNISWFPAPEPPPENLPPELRIYLHQQAVRTTVTDSLLFMVGVFACLASAAAAIAHFHPEARGLAHYAPVAALGVSVMVLAVSLSGLIA